jgi:ribosome-binding protein aMBF1 (putative translation factor)
MDDEVHGADADEAMRDTMDQRRHQVTDSWRAARAMVGWSRAELAAKSGMSAQGIRKFELGRGDSKQGTVQKWRRVLEGAGVRFIDADENLRLRRATQGLWPEGEVVEGC